MVKIIHMNIYSRPIVVGDLLMKMKSSTEVFVIESLKFLKVSTSYEKSCMSVSTQICFGNNLQSLYLYTPYKQETVFISDTLLIL